MTMFSDSMMLGGGKAPAFSNLAALFAGGADGIMIDFTDKTTLFQNFSGTIPVVSNGDPVGLALDQHKWGGLTLAAYRAVQPELVTNGDFATDVSGWTANANGSLSWDAGYLRITSINSSQPAAYPPAVATVVGRWYELTIDYVDTTATTGSVQYVLGTSLGGQQYISLQTLTVTGAVRTFFKATTTTAYVVLYGKYNSGGYTRFNQVSIKEIDGHHVMQSLSARPLWQSATSDVLFDGSNDVFSTDFNFRDAGNFMSAWAAFGPSGALRSPLGAAYSSTEYGYLLQDSSTGVMNAVMGSAGIAGTSAGSVANTTVTILGDQNALISHLFVNGISAGSRATPGDMPDAARGVFVFIGATSNGGSAIWFFNGRLKRIVAGQVRVQDTMSALEFHQNLIAP